MGIQDRDYYWRDRDRREPEASRYMRDPRENEFGEVRPAADRGECPPEEPAFHLPRRRSRPFALPPWIGAVIGLFLAAALLVLGAKSLTSSKPVVPTRPSSPSPPSPRVTSEVSPPPHATTQIRRCLVNGVVVDVLASRCPPAAPPTRAQPPQVSDRQPPAANPYVKPGTIYRCKNYSGGLFWSQAHCAQHGALIDRVASVPPTLPFQQQVDIAQAEAHSVEAAVQRQKQAQARGSLCAALVYEREQIWKRSGSGTGYVPPELLGPDRTRWKQIDAEMARLGCYR